MTDPLIQDLIVSSEKMVEIEGVCFEAEAH